MNTDFIITNIYRIAMVDRNEYKENTTTFHSNLRHNELIFHFSGESTVYFNDKVLSTHKNSVRFLPKGENKKYIVERKMHGECIFVCFDTDKIISDEAFVFDARNAVALGSLFKKMFATWASKAEGYYFDCMSILYKIFAELQKDNYIPGNQYKKIKPALDYIENSFLSDKSSISFLAQHCKVSESYLKKLFVRKFGISPTKYIIQMKVNYASDLLRTEEYTVSKIAEICGYNNIHFFSRQFKAYTGVTPREFRKKYKSSK